MLAASLSGIDRALLEKQQNSAIGRDVYEIHHAPSILIDIFLVIIVALLMLVLVVSFSA